MLNSKSICLCLRTVKFISQQSSLAVQKMSAPRPAVVSGPQSSVRFSHGAAITVPTTTSQLKDAQAQAAAPSNAATPSVSSSSTSSGAPHSTAADPAYVPVGVKVVSDDISEVFQQMRLRIFDHMKHSMVFRATYQARYGKPFSDTGFDVEFLDAFNSKGATIDTAAPEIAESPIPAFVFRWHQGAISFFDPEYSEKARKYALNDDRDVPVSDITYVNPVFSQSFGWTVESLQALGITAYALMSLDRHRSPVTRLLLDSCLAFTNTETQFPNVDFDTSIATTDGSFRWGNVRMIAMRGRLGYPVECVCYVRPPQLLVYPQPSQ